MKHNDKYEELCYTYLNDNDGMWDDTTYASESSKVKTILRAFKAAGFNGLAFYKALKDEGYSPYTIKMLVQRAAAIYAHGQSLGIVSSFNNPCKDILAKAPQLFRNAYKPERLKLDYDEAKQRVLTIPDIDVRDFCLQLLQTGLRIHEAYIVNQETSSVIGKGDKERFTTFEWAEGRAKPSEYAVRSALKKIGLKPHSLRKLLATKLSRNSEFSHADIMQVMGWSSIETASKYFQPLKEETLKQKLKETV